MSINLLKNIPSVIVIVFFATSFLVTTIFRHIGLATNALLFLLVLLLKIKINLTKINLATEDKHILWLFYLFFYVSFATVSFFNMFIAGVYYIKYYPGIFGRMANVTLYFVMFLFIINERNNERISTKTFLKAYTAGCFVLLFFGIWQILNMIFQVPYPDFGTRDRLREENIRVAFPFLTARVTSITQEPAYLTPFLMDAIIILFYTTRKYLLIVLFVIVLFFTLSLGGYVNFFLVALIMLLLAKKTIKTYFAKIFLFVSGIYGVYMMRDIVFVIFRRLNPAELFLSARLQNSILSIRYMFYEASLFNILFGFGPRGLGYVRNYIFYQHGWRQGEIIDITTHIIFVDFFIDFGIIGVLMIVLLFFYLFMLSTNAYRMTGNRLGQVLCLNLIITSLYTADYATPRFTAIMILLLCIFKDSKNKKELVAVNT